MLEALTLSNHVQKDVHRMWRREDTPTEWWGGAKIQMFTLPYNRLLFIELHIPVR